MHLRKNLREMIDRFRQWESNYEPPLSLVVRSSVRPDTETLSHTEVHLRSTLTALWYFFSKGLSKNLSLRYGDQR